MCLLGRGLLFVGLALTTGLVVSCSSGSKLSPVRGKVFYGGQPAEGAMVVLHRKEGEPNTPTPTGTVLADGSFTLRTFSLGNGAPPGTYTVVITWYPPNARESEDPQNKLPARYASVAESPLTVTIGEGPTELQPFEIPLE
jgi:hypothetical protein